MRLSVLFCIVSQFSAVAGCMYFARFIYGARVRSAFSMVAYVMGGCYVALTLFTLLVAGGWPIRGDDVARIWELLFTLSNVLILVALWAGRRTILNHECHGCDRWTGLGRRDG